MGRIWGSPFQSFLNSSMGIRFSCHGCAKPLNIKNDLAGRRGVCPECKIRFRIPLSDAEFSTPVEEPRSASETSADAVERLATQPISSAKGRRDAEPAGDVAQSVATVGNQASMEVQAAGVAATNPDLAPKSAEEFTPASSPKVETSPSRLTASDEFDPLGGDPTATWYVRPPSGGQYGPADAVALKGWISEGRVAKTALIWRDGWPQWREAAEAFPEISDTLPGSGSSESSEPFSEGLGGSKPTTAVSLESTSRVVSSDLSGDARIGAARRKRSSRRVTLVAVLATLVVGLIATLIIVATTRG
jgi:hypothetical protein